MKRTRQYPNRGARAARLFRTQRNRNLALTLRRKLERERGIWAALRRMAVESATAHVASVLELDPALANNPDTEVSEIHPPSVGLLGDLNAQFARLDRAIAGLK